MNVLPLVFSFLALLTLLTYSRLSGFVVTKAIHQEYGQFIENFQEGVQAQAAVHKYQALSQSFDKDAPPKSRVRAHRCLNLAHLTSNDDVALILKNLIVTLFAKAPFYEEAILENPMIVDEVIRAMQKALQETNGIKKSELCTLELQDEKLQRFFYKLLKDRERLKDEEDEELLVAEEATRIFNEVIIFNPEKLPIRVYLANPVLLQAIFQNEKVVQEIIESRKSYYKMVKKNPDRKEALTEEFTSRFAALLPPPFQPSLLNWEISQTSPDKKT